MLRRCLPRHSRRSNSARSSVGFGVQCHVCSQSKQKESTSTAQPRAERFLPRSAAADNSFFPGKALGAVVSAISAAAVLATAPPPAAAATAHQPTVFVNQQQHQQDSTVTITLPSHPHIQLAHKRAPPLGILNRLGIEDAMPAWGPIALVVAANIVTLKAVIELLRRMGDKSEPVTLVRLQWGLVEDHSELRSRLSELSSMNQVGQQGTWLMMEEALAELARYQRTCELADVVAVHLDSKSEGYNLFEEVAKAEFDKARAEEVSAHAEGEGECTPDWTADPSAPAKPPSLIQWLQGQPSKSEGCDDACVVTMVVATRGHIDVPRQLRSWHDMCSAMKALCGLSSDRLMAVDLTWAPARDSEYLTKEQLVKDYSNLKAIRA